jgi:hypothetical protein
MWGYDWIKPAQNNVQWRSDVNTIVYVRESVNVMHFLASSVTLRFLRRSLPHVVSDQRHYWDEEFFSLTLYTWKTFQATNGDVSKWNISFVTSKGLFFDTSCFRTADLNVFLYLISTLLHHKLILLSCIRWDAYSVMPFIPIAVWVSVTLKSAI